MHDSNFRIFLTFSMQSNQSASKIVAKASQIKLPVSDV